MLPSAFSTTVTQNSTTAGSTKGFLSFSSQSVIDSSKGPSLSERIKNNCLHLSANLHRYKGFDEAFHNFAVVFRMIQNYCICLMPGCTDFWRSNNSTSFFVYILAIPLHLCFLPGNASFHSYFSIVLFLFFLISIIFIISVILRNPEEYSASNSIIFFISLYCSVLTPILSIFVFTLFGNLLKSYIFMGDHSTEVIAAIVLSAITAVLVVMSHYFSFYLMRGTANIDFNAIYVPWAPYISIYAHIEMVYLILSFLEEFLPLNQTWFQVAFSIFALLISNPFTIIFMIRHPIFQDVNDIVYLSTQLTVNMITVILMDVRLISDKLTPTLLFVIVIISFALFLITYKFIIRRLLLKYTKLLYSVYKQSTPVLPPTTPLVFTTPLSNQVPLSHEAYSVMQAFSSLEITTVREFLIFIFVGAIVRMPAIKNIDFIKWGLNYFSDVKTLIICAQICQHFEDNGQTQTVLIQRLREIPDLSIFLTPILHNLELDHTDVISDKPLFLKMLQKKATGGLARCRRSLSLFWGCVLKHSQNTMNESLCKLRDSIYEANLHFDELIRCYPVSIEAIALYLNFLTEVKGEYLKCNQYINDMSAKFIEMKSDAIENDDSIDGISLLLQDPNRRFSPYISKLSQFMEQERQAHESTNGPIIAIWTLAIISSIALIVCILVIMIKTLVSFNVYPSLLMIVNSCDDVIMKISSLILGARRLCLFSAGGLTGNTINFGTGGSDTSMYDSPEVLIPWLLQQGDHLPQLILRFYKNATNNADLLRLLTKNVKPLLIFNTTMNGSLNFIFDMMCMSLRNIATNIPSLFEDIEYKRAAPKADLQLMLYEKMKMSFFDGHWSPHRKSLTNSLENLQKLKNVLLPPSTLENSSSGTDMEPIENFHAVCNSSEMNLLVNNIEITAELSDDFVDSFITISSQTVESLSSLLYYSMIFFPIGYVFVFGVALLIVCIYIKKEANFRLTLFLSLPEQVASEIFRAGGGSYVTKKKIDNRENAGNQSDYGADGTNQPSVELISPEVEQMKEKALTIESLYQFSSTKNLITGTGLKEYAAYGVVYIIIAAIAIFCLTFYARSVNNTFHARSNMLCYSALRYSSVAYASMFLEEGFFSSNISMFNSSEVLRLSQKFLIRAESIHRVLTYGSDDIQFDFREYSNLKNMILKDISMAIPDTFQPEPAYSMMQHDGYKSYSFDTFMRIFIESTRGMMETYRIDNESYHINDNSWQHYNHLIVGHLMSSLENATFFYLEGVSSVIEESFIVSLLISVVTLIVLLLLFVGPILSSTLAISRYFSTTLHVLCQVPPDVFNRSFYINKWLKGQISRSNYNQYENTFMRTVSQELQARIIEESPEKMILFSSTGEYIETHSYDVSQLEEKTLPNILSLAIDTKDQKIVEEVKHNLEKFQEAKDQIDNVVIVANSIKDTPIKLTVTGITSADLSSSISSVQRYYSYIAILIRDVTQEANEEALFEQEKEKTLGLLKQIIPTQFAIRIHDGERRISFSSGIGSVMSVMIDHYEECLEKVDLSMVSEILMSLRKAVDQALVDFDNVSMISMTGGEFLFVAGLFNDEQNGRTEAIDTLQFAVKLNSAMIETFESYHLNASMKFGICTGGPIYCKLIMDGTPVSIVSGDPVSMAKIIRDYCKSKQLLLERTTYECSYGLNIDAQLVGEFDFQGRHTAYYSLVLDKNTTIANQ
ncbi:hypothetical protein TRFO_32231 [Tritrichomonas foetus]|uniref:Guanylate cyclase domain-containing protein n=1 Tax=Tritrichomonas foetus TaxID=1144522 RepID=A0A1J4JTV3_9EUKA|nr:hypothetical protein TRFO_32231 [Tritrichomonas foetus]|eukprot:OHT00934.1 hypothetical protein TRFO_32231 [Tritrichomonas foetus]